MNKEIGGKLRLFRGTLRYGGVAFARPSERGCDDAESQKGESQGKAITLKSKIYTWVSNLVWGQVELPSRPPQYAIVCGYFYTYICNYLIALEMALYSPTIPPPPIYRVAYLNIELAFQRNHQHTDPQTPITSDEILPLA